MISSLRFARPCQTMMIARRSFSSECAPAQKLKEVFENYRKEHFSRELPSRFRKELVKSVATQQGVVEKDSLNQILVNIGRQDGLLTDEEYRTLCRETGDGNNTLSTSNMMKLF